MSRFPLGRPGSELFGPGGLRPARRQPARAGANGPVSVTFTGTNAGINEADVQDGYVDANGSCWANHSADVTATITDSVSTATYTASLYCEQEAP